MGNTNPLYDSATDNQPIAKESQEMINAPLAGGDLSDEDKAFLDNLMKLVEEEKINIHSPSTLLNQEVYESLPQEGKSKADMNAMAMLPKVRDIVDWEKSNFDSNHQVKNLIRSLRINKERLEEHSGDIFIF